MMPPVIALYDEFFEKVECPVVGSEPPYPDHLFLRLANEGDTPLGGVEIEVRGDGAQTIQLAVDTGEAPGVWTSPGGGIHLTALLLPGYSVPFWLRSIGGEEGGVHPFALTVRSHPVRI